MAQRLTAKRAWIGLMVVSISGALLTLPPPSSVSAGPALCNQSAPVCGGPCADNNTVCYGVNEPNATACGCVPRGCCRLNATSCQAGVPEAFCGNSTFVAGGSCDGACAPPTETPTASVTATATATASAAPTNTRAPDGGSCDDPLDCISGNCVNDVCCDTACDGPDQACNIPGRIGTCSSVAAAAPAASHGALLGAVALLLGIGGLALWRRRAPGI